MDQPLPHAVCSRCGAVAENHNPTAWTTQFDERGAGWLCPPCTRENLRSIEGRLDDPWW